MSAYKVGQTLRTLRLAADVTQTALAREVSSRGLRISQQAVDRIEHDLRSLRVEEAVQIAAVLDVHPGDLVQVTPERLAALEQLLSARAAGRRLRAQEDELEREQATLAIGIEEAAARELEASLLLESRGHYIGEPPLPGL